MTIIFVVILFIFLLVLFKNLTKYKEKTYFKNLKTYLISFLVLSIVLTLIIYPQNAVKAAQNGLSVWLTIVFPSLLPFLIGSEILIGIGVVNFLGVLLQPIMTPLFGVTGEGAFPFAMSITSGYPVGVNLVSRMRQKNDINRIEAQRLVSFCSTSGPLFIVGAVSVEMLGNPNLGIILASSHYLGAVTVGLLFKTYGKNIYKAKKTYNKNYIKSAFNELILARKKDGRPFSVIMSDAIKSSFNSMIIVGGFIILYSVIIELLNSTNLLNIITNLILNIIPFDLNPNLINGFLSGLIEMTNGCYILSSIDEISIVSKVCSISFLIAWSGLSIHSQSISLINNTDINTKIYLLSKTLHGVLSCIYSYLFYLFTFRNNIISSFSIKHDSNQLNYINQLVKSFNISIKLQLTIVAIMLIVGLSIGLFASFNFNKTKHKTS